LTGAFRLFFRFFLSKFGVGKFLVELVDPSGGVYKLHLSGKEGVRLARNLQFDQWIFVAVFPFDGILGGYAGFCEEGEIAGEILKHDVAIIGRMNIFFHGAF
jgi:hypothetical protein